MKLAEQVSHYARTQVEQLSQQVLHRVVTAEGALAVELAQGYIPLLLTLTQEDLQAKGLRTFSQGQAPQPPIHLAALEMVEQNRLLLLQGATGSGKTTFARHLRLCAAGALLGDPRFNRDLLRSEEPRNEQGDTRSLAWDALPLTLYLNAREQSLLHAIDGDGAFPAHWLEPGNPLLLVVDDVQSLDAEKLFAEAAILGERYASLRILLLGHSEVCANWHLPAAWQRYSLLPLLYTQRQAWLQRSGLARDAGFAGQATPEWLGHPASFGLALGVPTAESELDLYARYTRLVKDLGEPGHAYWHQLREAAGLTLSAPVQIARWLVSAPLEATAPIRLHARELARTGRDLRELFSALLHHPEHAECVLLAAHLAEFDTSLADSATLSQALLAVMQHAGVGIGQRVAAGRALARLGDPRDLLALCHIPAGEFTLGSPVFPNASPAHRLVLAGFRIGRYPVTNGVYRQFIEQTARPWRSQDGWQDERRNAPAVDLTWHDARAFCGWLTTQWQAEGRIRRDQLVRLPTEPEWEYAARGVQHQEALTYPWQGDWQPERSNGEEASLNDTCSVGLFHEGRSVWGCEDLCGQVWEWTSTLWGEDMAQPHWTYPYEDDGRERPDAADQVRRVLRGGCFSSPSWKACCSYRGSLEANGFWRGNGLRIVVSD